MAFNNIYKLVFFIIYYIIIIIIIIIRSDARSGVTRMGI
jgi:hypothetical protein